MREMKYIGPDLRLIGLIAFVTDRPTTLGRVWVDFYVQSVDGDCYAVLPRREMSRYDFEEIG
jgi:hypothetical protein